MASETTQKGTADIHLEWFFVILLLMSVQILHSSFVCLNNMEFCQGTYEPRREKISFCICENKDADQIRGNREADQHLCFRYIDSTIPLLSKSEISSL